MSAENLQVLNMEFGSFNELPESDQDYINKILFTTTSTCKKGKRPEFCWIENDVAGSILVEGTGGLYNKDIHPNMPSLTSQSTLPEQPVGVLPPHMIPAYYPVPVIGYGPGMPVPVPRTILPNPMMYSYAPQPVPLAVAPVFAPDTQNINHQQVVHEGNIHSNDETMDQSNSTGDSMIPRSDSQSSGADKPRRNKKKRPPGYYEQLEQQEKSASNVNDNYLSQNSSDIQEKSVHQISENDPARTIGINERVAITNENSQHISYVHDQNVSHIHLQQSSYQVNSRDFLSGPQNVQVETSNVVNVEISSQEDSLQNISSKDNPSEEIAPQTVITQVNDACHSKSQEVSRESLSTGYSISDNPVTISPNSGTSNTQTSQSQDMSTLVSQQNIDKSSNKTSENVSELESSHSDNKVAETNKQTESSTSNETAAEATCSSTNEKETAEAKPEPEVPKKPASWAGLFSSTKQAKTATVIYTENKATEAPGLQLSSDKALKEQSVVPVLVPASEDKSAPAIAEKIAGHRLNHKAQALVPRGLTNRKNWCYVNATLQALLACPPLYHLMKALPTFPKHSRGPSSTPFTDSLVRFINEFSNMHGHPETQKILNSKGTMKMDVPQGATFEPTYVYDVLKLDKYAKSFILGRQEDAEEFLGCLLNGMHEEMLGVLNPQSQQLTQEVAVEKNGDLGAEEDSGGSEAEDGWSQVGPKNKAVVTRSVIAPGQRSSPISEIFQGQIRSILHQSGQRESATLQPFFTLQLDIQSEKVRSVKDALENLVKRESLQDYTCTKTKQEIEASRRIMLETLPSVLVLHLKYFVFDKSGGSQKLTKHIEYPIDLEFNKDFLSPNIRSKLQTSQRKYKLFAVVNHHGARLLGGHYTTYVYHCGLNGWIHIDDEIVRTVQVASMLKHNPPKVPYLLYYRKVDVQ